MSVDILVYKVNKLTDKELRILHKRHVDDIDTLCDDENWEYKAYAQDEIEKNPDRFSEILKYAKVVEMRRTVTNYKQCYIDNGLPEDITVYSCGWHPDGVILRFNDRSIRISNDEIAKYSHEENCVYYVFKRQCIDADATNWFAKNLMLEFGKEYNCDFSYRPHHLTKKTAEIICNAISKEYESGDLYCDNDLFALIIYVMKVLTGEEKRLFIEFQN